MLTSLTWYSSHHQQHNNSNGYSNAPSSHGRSRSFPVALPAAFAAFLLTVSILSPRLGVAVSGRGSSWTILSLTRPAILTFFAHLPIFFLSPHIRISETPDAIKNMKMNKKSNTGNGIRKHDDTHLFVAGLARNSVPFYLTIQSFPDTGLTLAVDSSSSRPLRSWFPSSSPWSPVNANSAIVSRNFPPRRRSPSVWTLRHLCTHAARRLLLGLGLGIGLGGLLCSFGRLCCRVLEFQASVVGVGEWRLLKNGGGRE
ncbi:hypothetical protein D9758_017810 [Tetrapyrgos nigripes]|uniref:Uncharacterized protein n=1 Tax=Tetrapyrgos nigripes TaxID=182062 RepID=A0A8H5BHH8_9AGAR|nr:hypothetical protein D9758_017810 [Tetrapyrgos nigripes]